MNITEKTGLLVSIKRVNDNNDLVIINKSGITIRLHVADLRVMGRATQGVKLINLEKRNDEIASVCKVISEKDEELVSEGGSEETELINKPITPVEQYDDVDDYEEENDIIDDETDGIDDNEIE